MSNSFPDDAGQFFADKLKSLNPNNLPTATAVGWYERADYPKLLELFDDAESLPDSFDEWEDLAKRTQKSMAAKGLRVIQVRIDPKTFPKWCLENGFDRIDQVARGEYSCHKANEILRREIAEGK